MTDQQWTLGRIIRQVREEAGLTQDALATKADCSVMTISELENDKRVGMGIDTLGSIAAALGTSEAALYLRRDRLNAGQPDTPGLLKVTDLLPRRRAGEKALTPAVIDLAEQLQGVPPSVVEMALDIAGLSDHQQLAIRAVYLAFKAAKR